LLFLAKSVKLIGGGNPTNWGKNMGTEVKTRPIMQVKEPPLYRVIFINDDITSMEFVIASLVEIFRLTHDEAEQLTHKIHQEGSAVVAVLPYEIAEQKGIEVSILAKRNGYPLVVKLEADE